MNKDNQQEVVVKVVVTTQVKTQPRIDKLDALVEKFHSSRAAVLNLGLDLLAKENL